MAQRSIKQAKIPRMKFVEARDTLLGGKRHGCGVQTSLLEAVQAKEQEVIDLDGEDSRAAAEVARARMAARPAQVDTTSDEEESGQSPVGDDEKPTVKGKDKKWCWPPVDNTKWTSGSRCVLANQVLSLKAYDAAGQPDGVNDRWAKLYSRLQQPPFQEMFKNKELSAIRSQMTTMLKNKRLDNTRAAKQSGVSPPPLEGADAKLDKLVGDLVDDIASEIADKSAKKKQAQAELAETAKKANAARRSATVGLCRPGLGSTSYAGAATAARLDVTEADDDEEEASDVDGADGATNGESLSRALRLPRVSRVVKMRAVLPFAGEDGIDGESGNMLGMFQLKGIELDSSDFITNIGVSAEEVRLFMDAGWVNGELEYESAFWMMNDVLHLINGTAPSGRHDSDEYEGDEGLKKWKKRKFPGSGVKLLKDLCNYYGADIAEVKRVAGPDTYHSFTRGWAGGGIACETLASFVHNLTEMLLAGDDYLMQGSNAGGDSISAGTGKRSNKSDRKTRRSENRTTEESLFGEISNAAAQQALESRLDREDAKRTRLEDKAEAEAVRTAAREEDLRRWELDRSDRLVAAQELKDARDAARQERQDDIRKLELQLQLRQMNS